MTTGKILPYRQRRMATITRSAYNAETRELAVAFASETPVLRDYGNEILSCDPSNVELGRINDGGPLLLQHDPYEHIGVVVSATVDPDKICRAVCRLSRSPDAEIIAQDIVDGIRTKMSVGYETMKMIGETKDETGRRTLTWSWRPYEISLVSVPADASVGVGRSAGGHEEMQKMSEQVKNEPAPETREAPKPSVEVKQDVEAIRKEAKEIIALARQHKADALADKALAEGWGLDKFRSELLADIGKRSPSPTQTTGEIGMTKKEIERYNMARAIRSFIPGDNSDAAFELECSQEVARKMRKSPRSFFVPYDVQSAQKRDLTIAGTGSNAVATDLIPGSFVEALRNALVLQRLGVTVMSGLVGNLAVPKQSAASTGYWVAESAAPTESQLTLTQVTGTPKTVGANTDVTRNMLYQSSVDAEMLIRNDLAEVLARAIDYATFNDAGAGAPSYLLGISGVNNPSVSSAGSATYAEILAFLSQIAADNVATDGGAWVTTNEVFFNLCGLPRHATASAAGFIADVDNSTIIGRPAIQSESLPANTAVFGIWRHLILAMWGNGLDILVDPYTQSKAGIVQVRAFMDVDILCRHPQAFAYNSAVTA